MEAIPKPNPRHRDSTALPLPTIALSWVISSVTNVPGFEMVMTDTSEPTPTPAEVPEYKAERLNAVAMPLATVKAKLGTNWPDTPLDRSDDSIKVLLGATVRLSP